MTKQQAFDLLGCTRIELAKLLHISPEAVTQWDDDKIPIAREYQIRDLANGRAPIKVERTNAHQLIG